MASELVLGSAGGLLLRGSATSMRKPATHLNAAAASLRSHFTEKRSRGGGGGSHYWLRHPCRALMSRRTAMPCRAQDRKRGDGQEPELEAETTRTKLLQVVLWGAEAAYILWLFVLPYAPGDPVWAISKATVNDLIGLSLNFFFVLPISNSIGIHIIEAPVLHPMSEGLFNFVIGWTLLFAPLLFTDCRRDRYESSLDLLWGFQMFLTNTFLIPYMAIRLNDFKSENSVKKPTQLALLMTNGATTVAVIGGLVCIGSILWSFFGRGDGAFGEAADRLDFLGSYVTSDRLAYAFLWDILLYSIFQPWLIGDNLQNLKKSAVGLVSNLRFVPVVGLVAYIICLDDARDF